MKTSKGTTFFDSDKRRLVEFAAPHPTDPENQAVTFDVRNGGMLESNISALIEVDPTVSEWIQESF